MSPRPDPLQTTAGMAAGTTAAAPALRPMGFFEVVALTMLRSLDYRGRSTRLEFASWLGLAPLLCGAVAGLYFIRDPDSGNGALIALAITGCALLIGVAGLPLAVRRLHDLGRNAGWLLVPAGCTALGLLALASGLFGGAGALLATVAPLLCLAAGCLLPSQPGPNRYGPQPGNEVPA